MQFLPLSRDGVGGASFACESAIYREELQTCSPLYAATHNRVASESKLKRLFSCGFYIHALFCACFLERLSDLLRSFFFLFLSFAIAGDDWLPEGHSSRAHAAQCRKPRIVFLLNASQWHRLSKSLVKYQPESRNHFQLARFDTKKNGRERRNVINIIYFVQKASNHVLLLFFSFLRGSVDWAPLFFFFLIAFFFTYS